MSDRVWSCLIKFLIMFDQLLADILASLIKGVTTPTPTTKQNVDPSVYYVYSRVKIITNPPWKTTTDSYCRDSQLRWIRHWKQDWKFQNQWPWWLRPKLWPSVTVAEFWWNASSSSIFWNDHDRWKSRKLSTFSRCNFWRKRWKNMIQNRQRSLCNGLDTGLVLSGQTWDKQSRFFELTRRRLKSNLLTENVLQTKSSRSDNFWTTWQF
jgi:hypothetical protein